MLRGIHQYLSDFDDIYLVSSNRFCLILDIFFCVAMLNLREGLNEKKVPPPMTPIRATWSSFYGSRNSRFESQFRTKNTICTI